jgi:transcriptional regulator with XRE-family HTH domain
MSVKGTRHWSRADIERLRLLFPKHPQRDIQKAFPHRTWSAIEQRARKIGLTRKWKYGGTEAPPGDDLLAALRERRKELGLTAVDVAEIAGYGPRSISHAERGCWGLSYRLVRNWCQALGVRLVIEPIEKHEADAKRAAEVARLLETKKSAGAGVPVYSSARTILAAE